MREASTIRKKLARWYQHACRDLPWRASRDPYRIWISEVMLQQTRVSAVLPYYRRFLERFPNVQALAGASEEEVLASWAGLGYYSRARNLRLAANQIVALGGFPRDCDSIRQLAGVGEYTAAAVASIAFGEPRAVLDGNVTRVLARLTADPGLVTSAATRGRLRVLAGRLLDRRQPGRHNQALMELGATVCLPKTPRCALCPLAGSCEARRNGTPDLHPVKRRRSAPVAIEKTLVAVERNGCLLLRQRPPDASRLAGFWELPEAGELPGAKPRGTAGSFRHNITNHDYRICVVVATLRRTPGDFRWIRKDRLAGMALSTATRKALAILPESIR